MAPNPVPITVSRRILHSAVGLLAIVVVHAGRRICTILVLAGGVILCVLQGTEDASECARSKWSASATCAERSRTATAPFGVAATVAAVAAKALLQLGGSDERRPATCRSALFISIRGDPNLLPLHHLMSRTPPGADVSGLFACRPSRSGGCWCRARSVAAWLAMRVLVCLMACRDRYPIRSSTKRRWTKGGLRRRDAPATRRELDGPPRAGQPRRRDRRYRYRPVVFSRPHSCAATRRLAAHAHGPYRLRHPASGFPIEEGRYAPFDDV